MNLIINTSSMIPIYEQIMRSIKSQITSGELRDGDPLPSVRALSKDLRISALTAKKAYDQLEEEGFIVTVHGKGSYVKTSAADLIREEQLRLIENDLEAVFDKARRFGVSRDELMQMLDLITGE